MNILNKGFKPFNEQSNVIIYNKVIVGNLTHKRLQWIFNWIENVNKKTEHICYGWGENYNDYKGTITCTYHINIEVLNTNEL